MKKCKNCEHCKIFEKGIDPKNKIISVVCTQNPLRNVVMTVFVGKINKSEFRMLDCSMK